MAIPFPSKAELLAAYLATVEGLGISGKFRLLGAYRFDDPARKVGIETHLLDTDPEGAGRPSVYAPRGHRLGADEVPLASTAIGRAFPYL